MQSLKLDKFSKLNEAVSPSLLKDDELTKFEDCVLDEQFGKPEKRKGWARFNTHQVDTVSNVSSLHEVVAEGGNNYLLAGINGKLRRSLDGAGTWDDVTSLGTPPYRMQAYADKFIFTDGLVPPFIVSGTTLQTVTDLEITAPDVTLGADGVNGVQTGLNGAVEGGTEYLYKFIIVYVTEDGNTSHPSQPISVFMTAPSNKVGLSNLPISTDARVTQRYIYRTKANEEVYYFHSQIDNIITELVDSKIDEELGSETFSFINMPKTAKYVTLHKERIILGNLTRLEKLWVMPTWSKGAILFINGFSFIATEGFNDMTAALDMADVSTLTPGNYIYRVVFYDSEGLMSDYTDSNEVVVPAPAAHPYFVPLYASLPSFVFSYEVVKSASVYRSDNGGAFKFLFTYNPIRVGGVLTTGEGDYGSYTPTTVFASNQRTETEKCGVAFSDIGTPTVFNLEDIRNIFPDDGDEITGIYDDQDGILIFKVRSICKIFTNGAPDNWRLVKVVTGMGCDQPNSITKFGNDYIFSFQKEIYKYNSGSGYEKLGGMVVNEKTISTIKDSLKLVTAYHCATANPNWYLLGVSGAGLTKGFGFLVYDFTVGSWYKFNTTVIPYVAKIKEQGSSAGTILTSNATYILKYGTAGVDTDTEIDIDIVPIIKTKTFGDGIILNRLREIKFNYKKIAGKNCTMLIENPDTGIVNTHIDTVNSTEASGYKLFEEETGEGTNLLQETEKFSLQISGAGFDKFSELRLDMRPVKMGRIAV